MPKERVRVHCRTNKTKNYYCIHETGEVFNGVREIAKELGYHPNNISKHVTGSRVIKSLSDLTIYIVKGCMICGKPMESKDRSKRCNEINHWCCKKCERVYNLKYYHNLSLEEYDKLYKLQNGMCIICGSYHKRLCVDHNHKTGFIRGLLCRRCNSGLGLFRDNPIFIEKALSYLKKRGDYYSKGTTP